MVANTTMFRTLLACGLLQTGAAAALPLDGALDTGWGLFNSGKSPIAFDYGGTMVDYANGSVVGPDGSMYISGTVRDANGIARMGVTRLLPNGLIDDNFGTEGRAMTQTSQGELFNTAGIAMRNNSLLVGGYKKTTADNWDFVVCAFSTAGVPLLFNSTLTQCVTASIEPGPSLSRDIPYGIAVQPDGKIVMAGTTAVASAADTYAAFVRFETGGALDHTFGLSNSGIQLMRTSNFIRHQINAVAIASNGKIVAVGKTDVVGGNDSSALIVRLEADGTVDQLSQSDECAFEVDGSNSRDTELLDFALVPGSGGEDDLITVGYAQMSGTVRSGLIAKRLGSTCAYDASFSGGDGTNGYTVLTAGDSMSFESVAVQPNVGYVVAANYTPTGGDSDWLIGRYRPDGTSDLLINQIDFGALHQSDLVADVHVFHDGIYVAGSWLKSGVNYDFGAARLLLDQIFADGFDD
ncbi:MAG: hypothetical protein ACTHK2_10070 [Dokdonella sp.]|uniref:hypothetical protein n=1 Tax=Dokdonella sp. TaxID=2291710 RepID=UPI003F7F6680